MIQLDELTKNEVINKVKILQNLKNDDEKKDDILSVLFDLVVDEVYEIIKDEMFELNLESLFIKMLNYKYLRLGTESLEGYNYSGVSETFSSDYPSDIQRSLENLRKKNKKVRFL